MADLNRRAFLSGAGALGAWVLTGCSGGDDVGAGPTTTAPATSSSTAAGPPTTTNVAPIPSDPFTLGVASGDPLADSVVLWTRLAPTPLADDGLGGMPEAPVDVVWEVATDDSFAALVATGAETASPDHAHAVHAVVDGLDPGTTYVYRFRVGEFTSPVGTTKTLPDGSPERFAVAVANCQWLETGSYAAYRNMAAEDVDLVLHLGDYIYEYAGIAGPRMAQPAHEVVQLVDYRLRYASYHLDPDLAAVHARFPMVNTWDDHEVANNYMGDVLPDGSDGAARRTAAYQGWWEHLPTRLPAPTGETLVVDRSFDVGDLARVVMLDERQFSDPVPCRGEPTASSDFGDCAARAGEDRDRLGAEQSSLAGDALAAGGVTWTLVGNPVVLAGIDGGDAITGSAYYLDTWDGFPQARVRLIEQLATASNPVVLTGDYHAGMTLDVHATPFDETTPVVAPEFMAPPISSPLFADPVQERTPHLRQQLNEHGYLLVEATRDKLTASFRVVADVNDPASPVRSAAVWAVDPGNPVARQEA